MDRVAVIPARGGSKRVPGKNIRPFLGTPALGRTIETIQQSQQFSRVLVSTDSLEVAGVAEQFGAEVPGLRPVQLADDVTPTHPVVLHAVREWISPQTHIVGCFYPVTPLLEVSHIVTAVELAESSPGYVFAAERSRHPVQRALEVDLDGITRSREPQHFFSRSQDLAPVFFDVGQFYIARRDIWLEQERFHNGGTMLEVPYGSLIDVDTEDDWKRAEAAFSRRGVL